jgi:chromosome partitioning protein
MPIITIAGYKGGICKSTMAIAVASLLSAEGRTLVIDGDPNRSASVWAREGKLPFTVAGEREAANLISPCPPDMLSLDALGLMAQDLPKDTNGSVLISAIPPPPQTDGHDLRDALIAKGYPTFKQGIRFDKAYKNAVTEGLPIQKTKGGKIGWRDRQTLKPEILKAVAKPSSAKT